MTERPEPLVPADCDLRDFKFMPLEVERLRRSKAWLMAKRTPELGFYMQNLWSASWHEVPASSVEDDDDVLADLAMCDPRRWPKVREKVLRGWVKCTDGRLYHPVVAEKAREAWQAKLAQRQRTEAARLARAQKRSQSLPQTATSSGTDPVTKPVTKAVTRSVTESKGQGQGQGQGQRESESPSRSRRARDSAKVGSLNALALDNELRGFAAARGIGVDLSLELERFKNYCLSKGKAYKDYRAAFRNWLLKAKEFASAANGTAEPKKPRYPWYDETIARAAEAMRADQAAAVHEPGEDEPPLPLAAVAAKAKPP